MRLLTGRNVLGWILILLQKNGIACFSTSAECQRKGTTENRLNTILKAENEHSKTGKLKPKRIIFIRHGRTYMNDYINGIHYGRPGFTDVFPDTPENRERYYDSPLSPRGVVQVDELETRVRRLMKGDMTAATELSLPTEYGTILDEIELIVCSPLTRALQTMEKGLYTNIQQQQQQQSSRRRRDIPIVAVPYASERIFMISDLGKSRRELKRNYPYVDFDIAFPSSDQQDDDDEESWHYIPTDEEKENYVEWRPSGEGQVYACLGEPENRFAERMERLIEWLDSREENTIAVVCHGGVILWFLGDIIDNCNIRVVDFEQVKNPKRVYDPPLEQAAQLK